MSVCLKGNLDDFSIQDILQILSLGRKTGLLALETKAADGAVVFRRGRVLASVDDGGDPLDAELELLGDDDREELIRRRISASLDRLARCQQGDWRFEVSSQPPRVVAGRDIAPETLTAGIDVVELLLELAGNQDWEAVPGAPEAAA